MMRARDVAFAIERDDYIEGRCVPFDEDDIEHAHRAGRCLAEMIDKAFPEGVADRVVAGLVAARLHGQVDPEDVVDPLIELSIGAQADISPLCQALIPALGEHGIAVRFDDV